MKTDFHKKVEKMSHLKATADEESLPFLPPRRESALNTGVSNPAKEADQHHQPTLNGKPVANSDFKGKTPMTLEVPKPRKSLAEIMKNNHRTVVINVGGVDYRSRITNFTKYPASRLGKISRAPNTEAILALCDGYIPGAPPILYFDRNDQNFSAIMNIYRMGQLHICGQNCALVTQEDLAFWGIDELFMESCCALKYYPHIVTCQNEVEEERNEFESQKERQQEESFGDSCLNQFRSRIWNFLEYPESSWAAQCLAFTSLFMVCISTVTFVIGTNYEDQAAPTQHNSTLLTLDSNTTNQTVPVSNSNVKDIIEAIDNVAVLFFTIEYGLRLLVCPLKCKFVMNKMNLVDLLAIAPFFLSLVLLGLEDMQIIGKAGKIIRLVRIMRIMRIFKMVRHFAGLQSLVYTLQQASQELGLLFLIVAVVILLYTSLIFATEQEGPHPEQWTFYKSFWWGLMTLTTVGHNMTPATFLGIVEKNIEE